MPLPSAAARRPRALQPDRHISTTRNLDDPQLVAAFVVAASRSAEIELLVDPSRLRHIDPAVFDG